MGGSILFLPLLVSCSVENYKCSLYVAASHGLASQSVSVSGGVGVVVYTSTDCFLVLPSASELDRSLFCVCSHCCSGVAAGIPPVGRCGMEAVWQWVVDGGGSGLYQLHSLPLSYYTTNRQNFFSPLLLLFFALSTSSSSFPYNTTQI